jgi:phosphocarrier protein HPr
MSVDGQMIEDGLPPDQPASQPPASQTGAGQPPASAAIVRVLEICNKKGLHARASAKFVQTVEQFEADVWVTRGNERVGGTSIMGLMMLAAGTGTSITVEATGPQAGAVVEALSALVSSRFSEEE